MYILSDIRHIVVKKVISACLNQLNQHYHKDDGIHDNDGGWLNGDIHNPCDIIIV